VHERERQVEPAPHAARVAADAPVARLRQPDALEQLARAVAGGGAAQPVQRALHAEQLAPGHQRVDRRLLQRDADLAPHRVGVGHDVVAGDARDAGGRPQQRREDAHRRGLAGPVRAEEPVDLALGDLEVEAVDGADAALELADEPADLDGGGAWGGHPPEPRRPGTSACTPTRHHVDRACAPPDRLAVPRGPARRRRGARRVGDRAG
jgi:hypothetical protein